jgi:hypothetical protein
MNHNNFHIIDPSQSHLPDSAVIQKVLSEYDRLPTEQHDQAVRAFFVSDGIASGIGKDLAFVDQIPNFIKEIIDHKLWECLYVAKGVVTPYYCCYTKGTDSENFRAFITAKRPNGLETSIETVDRVLQADTEVQRKFREIIYESRQGQRTDLIDVNGTSPPEGGKLKHTQQERIRAANRAAAAIPEVADLLDSGLIAIDVAAQLGRDIKDPENLTAEEREYVDKRDLIGIRLRQYIYTNPIPEDEDREPAYSREINNFVKDLLGIKDRSKSVRMDNPQKAAEKLLQFYQGDKLQELVSYLAQALKPLPQLPQASEEKLDHKNESTFLAVQVFDSNDITTTQEAETPEEDISTSSPNPDLLNHVSTENEEQKNIPASTNWEEWELTPEELAERLHLGYRTVLNTMYNRPDEFPEWTKKRDPDGIPWQRSGRKRGRTWLLIPLKNTQE